MSEITRFAPSPTGHLHLGHAQAAKVAWERADGGPCFLRWEDLDPTRARREYEESIVEDLRWLGFEPAAPPWRQSERMDVYAVALDKLEKQDLLYPCFCTRKEIRREIERSQEAPHGPDGPLYPGTCRSLSASDIKALKKEKLYVLRLKMEEACHKVGRLDWVDRGKGTIRARPEEQGDIVLSRKETPTSYHLSVTVDDAAQRITLVTRGDDLFPATHVHRLLQALLGLPVPEWYHHPVAVDEEGKRLAKRENAKPLRSFREEGIRPEALWEHMKLSR